MVRYDENVRVRGRVFPLTPPQRFLFSPCLRRDGTERSPSPGQVVDHLRFTLTDPSLPLNDPVSRPVRSQRPPDLGIVPLCLHVCGERCLVCDWKPGRRGVATPFTRIRKFCFFSVRIRSKHNYFQTEKPTPVLQLPSTTTVVIKVPPQTTPLFVLNNKNNKNGGRRNSKLDLRTSSTTTHPTSDPSSFPESELGP